MKFILISILALGFIIVGCAGIKKTPDSQIPTTPAPDETRNEAMYAIPYNKLNASAEAAKNAAAENKTDETKHIRKIRRR